MWLGGKRVLSAVLGIMPELTTLVTDILTRIANPLVVLPTLWVGEIGRRLRGLRGGFRRVGGGLL